MLRAAGLLILSACAVALAACASEGSADGQSSIPWNRPQSWEGPGVYGSSLNAR